MPQSPEIMPMTGQEMPEPLPPAEDDGRNPIDIEDLRSPLERKLAIGRKARQEAKNAPPTNPPGSIPLVDESGRSVIKDLRSPLDRGRDIVQTARETAEKAQKDVPKTPVPTEKMEDATLRDEFNNLPDSLPERQEFIKKVIEHLAAGDDSLKAFFLRKGKETEPSTDYAYKAGLDAFLKKYAHDFLNILKLNLERGSTYENTVEILRSKIKMLKKANEEISAKQHQAADIAAALAEQPRPAAPEATGQEPDKKPGLFKRLASWLEGKKTT